jgi:hypothetical protein
MTRSGAFGVLFGIVALVAGAACGKGNDKTGGTGGDPRAGSGSGAALADLVAPATPVAKLDGPSITPTVTSSITFVTPKDPNTTWVEAAFPCYRAAVGLKADSQASQTFYQISPMIEPAMRAADIDLDRDVAAIGGWSCGDGSCIYLALALRHPERIPSMLATIPNVTPKQVAPNHWQFDAPGASGMRSIHVRTIPIQWGAAIPTDPWSKEMAKASHVLIVSGLFGKPSDVDPLTALVDPAAALARVQATEGVIADARERCVIGSVGAQDFKPGWKLDHARFVMTARTGKGDPLSRLLESTRSLDTEVELVLSPAPKEADVARWTDEARAWAAQTAAPIRAQFAGNTPAIDVYFDMAALIANRGFTHKLADRSVLLSWRTDRIQQAELSALATKLEQAIGTP